VGQTSAEKPPAKKNASKRSSLKSASDKPVMHAEDVHFKDMPKASAEREDAAEDVMERALDQHAKTLENAPSAETMRGFALVETQYLTAEDVFESELSRDRMQVKRVRSELRIRAQQRVKRWAQWSVAASLVPVPFVDLIAISGIQVKLIHDLCKIYGVCFEHRIALAVATGLTGGAVTKGVAMTATRAVARSMPGVGTLMTVAFEPTLSYATTYAIGSAFISHFEADGTLHNFNPDSMKEHFAEQLNKGKALFKQSKKAA
jgi:uncharacterized protein (DUF697 family)